MYIQKTFKDYNHFCEFIVKKIRKSTSMPYEVKNTFEFFRFKYPDNQGEVYAIIYLYYLFKKSKKTYEYFTKKFYTNERINPLFIKEVFISPPDFSFKYFHFKTPRFFGRSKNVLLSPVHIDVVRTIEAERMMEDESKKEV